MTQVSKVCTSKDLPPIFCFVLVNICEKCGEEHDQFFNKLSCMNCSSFCRYIRGSLYAIFKSSVMWNGDWEVFAE